MTKNKVCFFQRGSIEIVDGEGSHEFPYHTHESFMIGVVKSGEAKFVIGSNEYILGKGMTYLVPPNVGMSITPVKPYSYLTICIKNGRKIQLGQYKSDLYVLYNLGERVIGLCERFKFENFPDEKFIIELIETLDIQNTKEELNKECVSAPVKEAVKYIKEHVNDKFSLDELATSAHLSKYYLVRAFKNEMGITPKQYDQQCKIRKARESVLHEKTEVDIACDLSFSSQSHLCSMFKRYMGISMNDYKCNVEEDKQ
jgi:AraC-like DNA-binding protein